MDLRKKVVEARLVLANPGPLLPGSISEQYTVCGNPACQCSDPHEPKRHGPYSKLSVSLGGRKTTVFVHAADAMAAYAMTENYKAAREALNELALAGVDLLRAGGGEALRAAYAAASAQPETGGAPRVFDARLAASRDKWKAKAMERKASLERGRVKERDLCASRDKWRDESLAARRSLRQARESLERKESALAKREAELAKAKEELEELKKKRRAGAADLGGTAT